MKIAAICGAPNQNTGMMFVDRALYLYLKNKNLLSFTEFFCFQEVAKNKVGFEYQPLTKKVNLKDYDCIIIWGDFIVSNHFLTMTEPKIKKASDVFDYDLKEKVLLKSFDNLELNKVIVFGQCIFVDGLEVLADTKYNGLLKKLLDNTILFKVRDPLSAYRAKLIATENRDFLAIDSALLNYTLDYKNIDKTKHLLTSETNDKKTIGLFFARSKNINLKKKFLGYYLKFRLKQYNYKWIPWLENKQESKRFFSFADSCTPYSDIDYITEILKCSIIITDTYHLSLMAWSLGVPCICYGKATQSFKLTTHDKKKEIFFSSNSIEDFYFFTETEKFITDLKHHNLEKIICKGIETNVGEIVSNNIKNLSLKSIIDLDAAFDSISSKK
jgi:hypothetical protein